LTELGEGVFAVSRLNAAALNVIVPGVERVANLG